MVGSPVCKMKSVPQLAHSGFWPHGCPWDPLPSAPGLLAGVKCYLLLLTRNTPLLKPTSPCVAPLHDSLALAVRGAQPTQGGRADGVTDPLTVGMEDSALSRPG